jgi:hypothetical protein
MVLKTNKFHILFLVLLCFSLPFRAASQTTDTLKVDSLTLKHSPKKAALYSAVFPGLGQIYNKKYWKAPIVYVGLGALTYFAIDNNKNYQIYRKAYAAFLNNDPAGYSGVLPEQYQTKANFKNGKDFYRRWRDITYFSLVGFYILNIIDASVDANFFYYDVSDDLSMRIEPEINPLQGSSPSFGLNCSFTFNSSTLFKPKRTKHD